jgi:hypothetical protein
MRRAIGAQLADGSIQLDPLVRQAVERMAAHTPAGVPLAGVSKDFAVG